MNEQLVKVLGDLAVALSPVLVALISALAAFIIKKIKGSVKSDLLQLALVKVTDASFTVVKELEQTMATLTEFAA